MKEYSRSSADQEEPLPHQLRPLPVPSMTMNYMVTLIMDQDHDSYQDWYDFVWNRTSCIRKWMEFLLFAALLPGVCMIFSIVACFYTYVEPDELENIYLEDLVKEEDKGEYKKKKKSGLQLTKTGM